MTEEEVAYDDGPRRRRNRIYQVILVIVSLESLYFTFQNHSTPLNEWPADLPDHSAYCRMESYASCHDGAWFGILKSRTTANPGLLKEICKDWADKPDAANARMIETAEGDVLYLCKMKDPARIDPAKARI